MLNHEGPAEGAGELPSEDVIFGRTAGMQALRVKIDKVANTDLPLLIQGENGTGKELLARFIHAHSVWRAGSFVKVNCAAIPGALMESELFGYEKGAFTGAQASKPGRVEMADGGTLFLDEIGEIDRSLQAKLLQFLQDGQFSRIGDQEERRVNTRVICATSRELEEEIKAARFRMDLFYRINVICLRLPPLRDRREDITRLANHFLTLYAARFQREVEPLKRPSLQLLERRDWPGNIRELENWIARCVVLGTEEAMNLYAGEKRPSSFPHGAEECESIPLKHITEEARRAMEHDLILGALQANCWNRRRTAAVLKISYRTLINKIRHAGLAQESAVSAYPDSRGASQSRTPGRKSN